MVPAFFSESRSVLTKLTRWILLRSRKISLSKATTSPSGQIRSMELGILHTYPWEREPLCRAGQEEECLWNLVILFFPLEEEWGCWELHLLFFFFNFFFLLLLFCDCFIKDALAVPGTRTWRFPCWHWFLKRNYVLIIHVSYECDHRAESSLFCTSNKPFLYSY